MSAAKSKFLIVWEEINKEEHTEIEMDNLGADSTGTGEESEKEAGQVENVVRTTCIVGEWVGGCVVGGW